MSKFLMLLAFLFCSSLFGKSILFLGDSDALDGFGRMLIEDLQKDSRERLQQKQSGHVINSYSVCGSGPYTWVRGYPGSGCGHREHQVHTESDDAPTWTSSLNKFLEVLNPDLVIIQTGENMVESVGAYGKYVRTMKQTLIDAGTKSCVWITPRHASEYQDNRAKMAIETEDIMGDICTVFRSDTATRGKKGFGSGHFATEAPSRVWLDLVYPTIKSELE